MSREEILREIAEMTFEAGSAGLWVAAEELPAGRRRAARVALALAASGYAWWRATASADRSDDEAEDLPGDHTGREDASVTGLSGLGALRAGGSAATAALGAASPMVRRLVGPRWLRQLEEAGVVHPYRALGRRVALASFAVSAATRLPDVLRDA